jgi:plastocyanin
MELKIYHSIAIISILGFALFIGISTLFPLSNQAWAQFGELFPTLNKVQPTYIVNIPAGASQNNGTGYVPKDIAIPTGTTIAWFNTDPGSIHTVTSGSSNSTDRGNEFNSGGIPYSSFFMYTFEKPGLYHYFDAPNPSSAGSIYVNSGFEAGHNFIMRSGVDLQQHDGQFLWTLNKSKNDRFLLDFEPRTIQSTAQTPVTYNITMYKESKPVFSQTFMSLGNVFQIEFINSDNNQTTVYGPDFSDPITGAYHVQTPLKDGSYTIRAEIVAIGSDVPDEEIVDEFKGRIIS